MEQFGAYIFPMHPFHWSIYISQVPCLSEVNHSIGYFFWVELITWRAQLWSSSFNKHKPMFEINASKPNLICVTPCEQKTSKKSNTHQRLGSISEPTSPPHTALDVHHEGFPQVGSLTGQCIYGHYANSMWNILPFLQFSCNLNQIS